MNKAKLGFASFLLIVLIAGTFVSAASIQFIDAAYLGNGTLSITTPGNEPVAVLKSLDWVELHNGTAYMLDYQPSGFVTLDKETIGFDFPILKFLLVYFSIPENLIAFLVLILLFILLVGALG